jgi:hypothetical protein
MNTKSFAELWSKLVQARVEYRRAGTKVDTDTRYADRIADLEYRLSKTAATNLTEVMLKYDLTIEQIGVDPAHDNDIVGAFIEGVRADLARIIGARP